MGSLSPPELRASNFWLSPHEHLTSSSRTISVTQLSPTLQRVGSNRSPVESPPALKKALKGHNSYSGVDRLFGFATSLASPLSSGLSGNPLIVIKSDIGVPDLMPSVSHHSSLSPVSSFSPSLSSSVPSTASSSALSSASSSSSSFPLGKENQSILKRTTANNGTSKGGSARRRVEFEPSVQVFHFDKVAGEHVGSESQRLCEEPSRDRRTFLSRTLPGNRSRASSLGDTGVRQRPPSPSTVGGRNKLYDSIDSSPIEFANNGGSVKQPIVRNIPIGGSTVSIAEQPLITKYNSTGGTLSSSVTSQPRPLPVLHSSSLAQSPSESLATSMAVISAASPAPPVGEVGGGSVIDFTFFEDEARRLRLKFTIPLGEGVSATDVLVKANMTGNRVRVVAWRTIRSVSSDTGATITKKEELSERYLLPMEVDPYLISARLDGSGNLFVEAPILTPERRRTLSAEKTSRASNSPTDSGTVMNANGGAASSNVTAFSL